MFQVDGIAMIFNSSNPTGGDLDLGTPHSAVAGGPGVGFAGKPNQLFSNIAAQGNVLIVSEDGNVTEPDDNQFGGTITFDFDPPVDIDSIGLLDNGAFQPQALWLSDSHTASLLELADQTTTFYVQTSDGGTTEMINENGGNNSFEQVAIGKPQVAQLVVTLDGSAR